MLIVSAPRALLTKTFRDVGPDSRAYTNIQLARFLTEMVARRDTAAGLAEM